MNYKHHPLDDLEEEFLKGRMPLEDLLEILGLTDSSIFMENHSTAEENLNRCHEVLVERVRLTPDRQVLLRIPLSSLREGREYRGEVTPDGEAVLHSFLETDVHTEHCCLRCGCKYSSSDCTVVMKTLKQSAKHLHTSVCYEDHPDYIRRQREFRGEGDGGFADEFSQEAEAADFPVYLASLLGVPEETPVEELLLQTALRLGLSAPISP